MEGYSIAEGKSLIAAARSSVELFLRNPHFDKNMVKKSLGTLSRRNGVYVTINHYPTGERRGRGGFVTPASEISEMVVDASIAAAFEDKNFVPISINELEHIVFEVTLISKPIELKGGMSARMKGLRNGDGLMVQYGTRRGIVLPSNPARHGWTKRQLLEEVCIRAGISPNHWTQPKVKLHRLECVSFVEEAPEGAVIETATM